MKPKTNLVWSQTNRAIKICSEMTSEDEIQNLHGIFRQNGSPPGLVDKIIASSIQWRTQNTVESTGQQLTTAAKSSYILMWLPWIGDISRKFKAEIEEMGIEACPTTILIISFTTTHAFNRVHKDVLPVTSRSHLVHNYKCCCEKRYVGKTTPAFLEHIKHVTSKLVEVRTATVWRIEANNSAITRHLRERLDCLRSDSKTRFKVLAQAWN